MEVTALEFNDIKKLPVLPLRGIIVFPGMIVNLDVGRQKSMNAVSVAMTVGKRILLTTQKTAQVAEPVFDDLYNYGVVAEIK